VGKHFLELGVCVPRYDDLKGEIVCAYEWKTDIVFFGRPLKRHHTCGLDDGHTGDHKTSTGETTEQESNS